jgi:glucose/arabinose dehydrogenase
VPTFAALTHVNNMKRSLSILALAAPLLLAAQVLNKPKVALRNWATGFNEPVCLAHCGDSRLFVVEKDGIINIVSDSMTVVPQPFLDISGPVNSAGNEQGLLGLAFEPNYLDSGYFYVYYIAGTGNGNSRVSRFRVSDDPDSADVASEQILYEWPQPYANHNGGDIHFGPDGYLYVGFGDGGSGNDPEQNGQDYLEPLAGMIRIDVSQHDSTYLIPPSNPFSYETGTDTLPETWAVGLRNPFRWSFDRQTGDLWIGDVGQNAWEEVDFWPAGDNSCPNFGWRCREAFVATPGISQTNCQGAQFYESPLAAFDHAGQGWCSVIGGYVYRGSWYPHHTGHYIFTDYCAGDFLTFAEGSNSDVDTMLMSATLGYAAFGEDVDGQLYVADQQGGTVQKLYDPCPMADPAITNDGYICTATAGNSYQWYLNGVLISGANQQTYIPQVSGNYQVRVNFGTPCTLFSDTLAFIATGIIEQQNGGVAVFPQPARNEVTIERSAMAEIADLAIIDGLGRSVVKARWSIGQKQMTLNVELLPAGAYVLRMSGGTGNVSSTSLIISH